MSSFAGLHAMECIKHCASALDFAAALSLSSTDTFQACLKPQEALMHADYVPGKLHHAKVQHSNASMSSSTHT